MIARKDPISSYFRELSMLDLGVLLCQFISLLFLIVKAALVFLGVAVLAAENEVALTREAQQPHLAFAFPTDILVSL